MPSQDFTPDQANALLAEVRPLAERLVRHRRVLSRAQAARTRIVSRIAGNGAGIDAGELAELDERIGKELTGIARCVNAIHELGAVVKDPDEGLVDFPSRVDGREVYLCWKLGEDAIEYWHGIDEGFAGRKPL
ncbi:MAG TPA: DUF2203 domain-containing protein [Gaiellaceae bacterium]|nr:DUF2203 domain-containing protein [Gaiellaceae bacterium]